MEQILVIAIVGTLLAVTLKSRNGEMRVLISITTGILIFLYCVAPLKNVLTMLHETAVLAGISEGYFAIILKVIAIAYLTQFGAEICKDAGEGAIGTKVELAGKILMIAVSAPVLSGLVTVVIGLV